MLSLVVILQGSSISCVVISRNLLDKRVCIVFCEKGVLLWLQHSWIDHLGFVRINFAGVVQILLHHLALTMGYVLAIHSRPNVLKCYLLRVCMGVLRSGAVVYYINLVCNYNFRSISLGVTVLSAKELFFGNKLFLTWLL